MSDHQAPPSIGKRIGEFLILGIYLAIDVAGLWHESHFWTLIAAFAGVVALLLLDGGFSRKQIGISATATAFICLVIYFVAPSILPEETDIHGWLLPANDHTPDNGCGTESAPDKLLMVFGTSGLAASEKGYLPQCALQAAQF